MKVNIGNYPHFKRNWTNLWGLIKCERKTDVKIDRWDCWSLDYTLAMIIHPALVDFKSRMNSTPFIDINDIPEDLREEFNMTESSYNSEAWDWVLDEMIWAFGTFQDTDWDKECYSGESDLVTVPIEIREKTLYEIKGGPNHTFKLDTEKLAKLKNRRQHGINLFAKYFTSLWV